MVTQKRGNMAESTEMIVCEHPECNKKIKKSLQYACGGKQEKTELSCDKYFCDSHRFFYILPDNPQRCIWVCEEDFNKNKEKE